MTSHHINGEMSIFAHKNLSKAPNTIFSISMILLVLVTTAQNGHSINSTAASPDGDSVFYRIETSIRRLQDQFWDRSLNFLRQKKRKLAQVKSYLTVDETYDSYTGNLHKKPVSELTSVERKIRRYIHSYKPKKGDTGSFKLIGQLQKDNIPFVIRARLCDYMKKILGIYREWKSYDYVVADLTQTTLILGRDFRGFPWGFVTNLHFNKLEAARFIYKKRWNIENIFKATDGIQIRVATNNYVTRMFCVCLSFIIYNAWQQRNTRPSLIDHVNQLVEVIFALFIRLCPYRDKLKLNIPFWDLIRI